METEVETRARDAIYDRRFMTAESSDEAVWGEYAAVDAPLPPMYPAMGWKHHPLNIAIRSGSAGAVLDFGCGTGRFRPFFDGARRYVGLDQSFDAVKAAIERWSGDRKAMFVHCPGIAEGRRIPFMDGSFDLVFTCGVLQHAPDGDLSVILGEIRRVMAEGAKYVGYEAVTGQWWPRGIEFPPHGRTAEGWRAAFEPHGFSPVSQEDGLHIFRAVSDHGRRGEAGDSPAG